MKRVCILFLVGLALLLLGCGRRGGDGGELLLYCGAGIRPPVAEIIEAFESEHDIRIVTDYAGSETLLSKIKLARTGDLYLPGDKYYVDQAAGEDMVSSRQRVFYWTPTILVQKGNPKEIGGLKDLLKEGVRVGLGDAKACAIGRTTEQILSKNGMTREQLAENLKYQSQTVNELGLQIQAGALDAVIVWDAMARYYEEYGEQVAIEAGANVISSVDIGVLAFSENKERAGVFVDFLTSARGRAIFEKHGYSTAEAGQ